MAGNSARDASRVSWGKTRGSIQRQEFMWSRISGLGAGEEVLRRTLQEEMENALHGGIAREARGAAWFTRSQAQWERNPPAHSLKTPRCLISGHNRYT